MSGMSQCIHFVELSIVSTFVWRIIITWISSCQHNFAHVYLLASDFALAANMNIQCYLLVNVILLHEFFPKYWGGRILHTQAM